MIKKRIAYRVGLVAVSFFMLPISGCVTEHLDSRTGEPILQKSYDRKGAGKTRMSLGLEYLREGDMINAKINLEKAEKHLPDDPEVLSAFAYFYDKVKNYPVAEEYYERAISIKPIFGDALNNYGTFLCHRKEYARADALFQQAIVLPSYIKVASSFENAGICAHSAGNIDKAVSYFEQAIAYDPQRTVSLLQMAKIRLEQSQYNDSRYYLTAYDAARNPSAESLFTWFELETAEGNSRAAEAFGIELLTLFPNSVYAKKLPISTPETAEPNKADNQMQPQSKLSPAGPDQNTVVNTMQVNEPAIAETDSKAALTDNDNKVTTP